MPETLLSQNEIDALFSEMARSAEGGDASRERFRSVRPYDFRHPSKLSKDQVRTLQMIFEAFARLVTTNLAGALRAQAHVALVSIEQSVFDDYARALPQRTLLNLASVEPLHGTVVFEYDVGTAFLIVDRMLGGIGKAPADERPLTDIEEVLLHSAGSIFLDALAEAWAHLVPMTPKLQQLELSPRFLQVVPRNEPVVLMLFDLRIQERQTTLSMCIPYTVIEPVAAKLNVQALFTTARSDATLDEDEAAFARLRRVAVPVAVRLGETTLPLAAVNDLRAGDVVRLDGLTGDPLLMTVNNQPTYVVRPGLVRNTMAVQVVGVLSDGDA